MKYIYYGSELYHHGIKGQKWGVRNGPPYPLSTQKHNHVTGKSGSSGRIGSGAEDIVSLAALSVVVATPMVFRAINKSRTKKTIRRRMQEKPLKIWTNLKSKKLYRMLPIR